MRLLREGKQYRVFGRRRGYLKLSCWSVLRLQSCVYGQLPDLCRIKHFITRHLALHKQNQHFDTVLTTPQPSNINPGALIFFPDEVTLMEPITIGRASDVSTMLCSQPFVPFVNKA